MLGATPIARALAVLRRRRREAMPADAAQHHVLAGLLKKAETTQFGRDHGFASISDVANYQAAVPLRRYEDFWQAYFEPGFPVLENVVWPGTIPYFAESSGTSTGRTKYIPVTGDMVRANTRASLELIAFHLRNRPHSRLFAGRSMMLGGDTGLRDLGAGVLTGDLTGIAQKEVPAWADRFTLRPEKSIAGEEWHDKIDRLARRSMAADIRMIAGTSSWLLTFLDRAAELAEKPRSLTALYPRLDLMVHGGVRFEPYAGRFAEYLDDDRIDLREVYPASEGFIAIADREQGEGLRLNADNGIFFEFVPVGELDTAEPRRFWLGNVEPGVNYAVVLTTCAGLWSYVLGDTVRFVDLAPPRIVVTGRTSYDLSVLGEHLSGEEIEHAMTSAALAIGANVVEFSAAPLAAGRRAGEAAGHLYVVELDRESDDDERRRLADTLDRVLRDANADYDVYRERRGGLAAPRVETVAAGTFETWMKRRGRIGGQNKVPRVITDEELLASLTDCARDGTS